jgi:hypothetical protein
VREKHNDYAQVMLPIFHHAECDDWDHLATGNELWSSWACQRVACRLWREITCSQCPDSESRVKIDAPYHSERDELIPVDALENNTQLNGESFVTHVSRPLEEAIFSREKKAQEMNCSSCWQLLSSHKCGFGILPQRTLCSRCHIYLLHLIWVPVTFTHLRLQKDLRAFRWLAIPSLSVVCHRCERVLMKTNWTEYYKSGCYRFKKQAKATKVTWDYLWFLSINLLEFQQTWLVHAHGNHKLGEINPSILSKVSLLSCLMDWNHLEIGRSGHIRQRYRVPRSSEECWFLEIVVIASNLGHDCKTHTLSAIRSI